VGLAAINYIVDPYMLFQSQRISGFNDKKPASANRSRLFKPYNVTNIQPHTIVVGNSRPEIGIDPKSTCWPPINGTVYSLTFPGLGTYAQVRALFHAVAAGQVNNILLGVDFVDFLYKRNHAKKAFWPKLNSEFFSRLVVDEIFQENKNYSFSKIKDFSTSLFSLNALNDSFITLISQFPNSKNRTNLGFNTARDYHEIIQYEGSWVLFEQKKKELDKQFSKAGLSIFDSGQWSIEFEAIKRVIQLSLERNIKLTLFINPYHYTYLESIRNAGYWEEFETFKKSLNNIVKKYGKEKVMIWDFSLYSDYTVSPIPTKVVNFKKFDWFWEPAHYKAELGELMLRDMYDMHCIKENRKPVGVNLNNSNIDIHLSYQQKQRLVLLNKIHLLK